MCSGMCCESDSLRVNCYSIRFLLPFSHLAPGQQVGSPAAPRARLTDLAHLCVHKQERQDPVPSPGSSAPLPLTVLHDIFFCYSLVTCYVHTDTTDRQTDSVAESRESSNRLRHMLSSRATFSGAGLASRVPRARGS